MISHIIHTVSEGIRYHMISHRATMWWLAARYLPALSAGFSLATSHCSAARTGPALQCNERPANLDRNQTGVLYLPRTTLLHSPFIRLIYTSNVLILLIFLMHIHISKQKCYFQNLPVISQIVWGVRCSERPTSHLTLQQPDTADCPPARELSGPTTLPGFPLIWFGRIWIRKILASYKDLSFLHVNGSNCPLSLSPFFVPLVWRGECWMVIPTHQICSNTKQGWKAVRGQRIEQFSLSTPTGGRGDNVSCENIKACKLKLKLII